MPSAQSRSTGLLLASPLGSPSCQGVLVGGLVLSDVGLNNSHFRLDHCVNKIVFALRNLDDFLDQAGSDLGL